jgi:DNA repair exonuclease SbcCD ATPase subunit
MEESLKIKNLEIDGFGNIDHVRMRELGERIILEGMNGAGKTMILTAVLAALEGKTGLPERPLDEWVKDGYESAVIKVDLDDGKAIRFKIRVVITGADFDLTIKEIDNEGKEKKISSPMTFLKSIINVIAFRPQQWRKKSDIEQLEEVFRFLPGLKEKLADNDKKVSELEQERARLLNRSKVLRLDIDRVPLTPNLPDKEIEPKDVLDKLQRAQKHNLALVEIKTDQASAREEIETLTIGMATLQRQRTATQEMLEKLKAQLEQQEAEITAAHEKKATAEASFIMLQKKIMEFVVQPVDAIERELEGVKQKNEAIRQNQKRLQLMAELDQAEESASAAYRKIKASEEERRQIMATVQIPVDGLQIGNGCLMYPNSGMEMVRLSALSDGEFWPVACGLVAAFKTRVRIMIVDSMNDLDKFNFEALCLAGKRHNMQSWIEHALWDEENAGIGFLIRDGKVIQGPSK